ncbi:hypothetical protein PHSY_001454 [Pseudozyma hubeiensis SY62]|uniref:Uncharacterized protein n=1 Tax=Pseudozyma hubeiensis (strain SY62) TaxID=1305764 RepID=R9NZ05_PSEHS|nr:hypothetical protein PHSY_001454 [Pseudozyma hubeiensis SY62]GAC93887.1 hypothetical protein PHSY_001454 [Pseudozyma hubeiensis SY62]
MFGTLSLSCATCGSLFPTLFQIRSTSKSERRERESKTINHTCKEQSLCCRRRRGKNTFRPKVSRAVLLRLGMSVGVPERVLSVAAVAGVRLLCATIAPFPSFSSSSSTYTIRCFDVVDIV